MIHLLLNLRNKWMPMCLLASFSVRLCQAFVPLCQIWRRFSFGLLPVNSPKKITKKMGSSKSSSQRISQLHLVYPYKALSTTCSDETSYGTVALTLLCAPPSHQLPHFLFGKLTSPCQWAESLFKQSINKQ